MKVTLITIIFFPKRKVNKYHKEILIILYIYIYTHTPQETRAKINCKFLFFIFWMESRNKFENSKKVYLTLDPQNDVLSSFNDKPTRQGPA